MLRYTAIAPKEKDLLAMTGSTKQEFEALVPQFQKRYDEYLTHSTIEGYERIGQIPKPYHTSPLPTIEDTLLFILVYLKQNPTQTLQGYLFGMSQTTVTKWFHLLHTVLKNALSAHHALPERTMMIPSPIEPDGLDQQHSATDGQQTPDALDEMTEDARQDRPSVEDQTKTHPPFFSTMGQNDR